MNRKVDSATNLMISANDLEDNTATYVEYLNEFTGKEKEVLMKDIARTRYFTPEAAIEYGIVDKVVNPQSGGLQMEKKDYEAMLKAAGGGGSARPAYAGRGGGD
jgi:ATP-dependent Clp protease protease subunit